MSKDFRGAYGETGLFRQAMQVNQPGRPGKQWRRHNSIFRADGLQYCHCQSNIERTSRNYVWFIDSCWQHRRLLASSINRAIVVFGSHDSNHAVRSEHVSGAENGAERAENRVERSGSGA